MDKVANSIKILRTEQLRLKRIREGLSSLEHDVRFISTDQLSFHLCIDFHNLRQYLAWQPPRSLTERVSPSRIAEEYVSVLIFHALPHSLVLLPSYYDEFTNNVRALVFDRKSLEGERDLWLTKLRKTFTEEIIGDNGLLAKLEQINKNDLDAEEANSAIRELTERVEAVILELAEGMNRARQAVAFVERFDYLFRSKKLVGLKAVLNSINDYKFGRDSVYWKAFGFLESKKSGRDKITANENDARAISLVRQLNRILRERREICLLVSSAALMRAAVDVINDELAPHGERVELRDLEYWRLWFSCVSAKTGDQRSPSVPQVLELSASLEPVLAELEAKCLELLEQLGSIEKNKTRIMPRELVVELDSYLFKLGGLLERIGKPIVDGRLLSAEFESGFVPIASEEEFNTSMATIRSLLERIKVRGENLLELKGELESVVIGFESILLKAESEAKKYYDQITTFGTVFISEWMLRDEEMREPYTSLLQLLEHSGASSANAVIERCMQLRANKEERFEGRLVMARAYLAQGNIELARSEFDGVPKADRVRPSVQLLGAAILTAEGRFKETEEALRDLKRRYGGPVVLFSLGSVLAARYEDSRIAEIYEDAIVNLKQAAEESGRGSRVYEGATAARIRLELLRERDIGNSRRLLELKSEIERLKEDTANNGVLERKIEELQALAADIVASAGEGSRKTEI